MSFMAKSVHWMAVSFILKKDLQFSKQMPNFHRTWPWLNPLSEVVQNWKWISIKFVDNSNAAKLRSILSFCTRYCFVDAQFWQIPIIKMNGRKRSTSYAATLFRGNVYFQTPFWLVFWQFLSNSMLSRTAQFSGSFWASHRLRFTSCRETFLYDTELAVPARFESALECCTLAVGPDSTISRWLDLNYLRWIGPLDRTIKTEILRA